MPLTLAALAAATRTVTFEYLGEQIHVTYRLAAQTIENEQADLQDRLAAQLVSWDVLDDDGKPYPTDAESLKHFPAPIFLLRVAQEITRDVWATMRVDPTPAGTSGAS